MRIIRFAADVRKSCVKDLVTPLLPNLVDFQRERLGLRLK